MGKAVRWNVANESNPPGETSGSEDFEISRVSDSEQKNNGQTTNVQQAFVVMSLSPTTSYKATEPTFYPWTIRHDSFIKAVWDWIILLLVIYTAIEIPYNVAFLLPAYRKVRLDGNALEITNLIVDVMFVVDIIINFRTTYVCGRGARVVCEPKDIASHYLKTWFIVDFLAAIPFELFAMFISKEEFTLISLLKTARLLRLVRVARKLDRYSEYGIAVIFLLMGLFTLSAHWLACIWYAIGSEERDHHAGWINALSRELTGTVNGTHASEVSITSCYITALYFTLSSLTSVGFGNVASNTNAEKVFAVCVMLAGALMYATIFGNLTAIIQRLYSRTSKYHKDLSLVKEFINFYEIPSPLSDKLEEYTKNTWSQTKGVTLQKVLERFPETLQNDVCYYLRQDLFNGISAFKEADKACLRSMAMKFHTSYYLPNQCIIRQGDPIQEIYFIASGVVEITRDGKSILSLGKSDVISCDYKSLHHIPKANSDLTVRTLAEIHSINYDDLLECLRAYPVYGQKFFEQLEVSYRLQEFTNINEEFVESSRRFSNARLELASFHKFVESNSTKSKPNRSTYIEMETKLPSNQGSKNNNDKKQPKDNNEQKMEKSDEMLSENNISERLNDIDKRLSLLEQNITTNFNQIMSHLKAEK